VLKDLGRKTIEEDWDENIAMSSGPNLMKVMGIGGGGGMLLQRMDDDLALIILNSEFAW
jgi:hypothetical protein